jgi:hypothetical protein
VKAPRISFTRYPQQTYFPPCSPPPGTRKGGEWIMSPASANPENIPIWNHWRRTGKWITSPQDDTPSGFTSKGGAVFD